MLKNIDNQIPVTFEQVTPSKTWQLKALLPTNHLKQDLLREIKRFISSLQQHNKIHYIDEYIKAIQDQFASLKSEVMFLRGELKEKNAFIEQLNSNNNNNSNIINRNNNSNNNNDIK